MKKFYLTQIITRDKLIHQGIYYKPSRPGRKAILWVHGLTDNFYGDVETFQEFAHRCEKEGWGFASFNTRGHDIVSSISKVDPKSPKGKSSVALGSATETFTDCVLDLEAAVSFLEKQGFTQVIPVGISTGANKVCYWAATVKDTRVVGVVLASAISDVGIKMKELGKRYRQTLAKVKELAKKKKDELMNNLDYMPITPARFLSAYEPNGQEDVFPYYQKNHTFSTYSKITKPLMIIMGERDEYADMPVSDIVDVYKRFSRSRKFDSVIIKGGFHSFGGKEKEFTTAIAEWVSGL